MLSHLEYIKLQHLLSDLHKDQLLLNNTDTPLSDFNPLTYQSACGDKSLHIAVIRSDLTSIQLLLKGGAEINAEGDNEYTPLDYALSNNNGDIVSYLIEHGGVVGQGKPLVRKWIKDNVD